MKKLIIVILSVLILGSCMSAGKKTENDWNIILTDKPVHPVTVCGFINDQVGITAGYAGETHYTADSGLSWPRGTISVYCRFALDIIDSNTAVSSGNGGVALSSDGGKNWKTINSDRYDYISFSDAETGWILDADFTARTSDGGRTWKEVKLPFTRGLVRNVCITGYDSAWVMEKSGIIYKTRDGGDSWEEMDPAAVITEMGYAPAGVPAAYRFISDQTGLYITKNTSGEDPGWLFCETSNGGESWEVNEIKNMNSAGIQFISHDNRIVTLMKMRSPLEIFVFGRK